jgi:hypothetical protein
VPRVRDGSFVSGPAGAAQASGASAGRHGAYVQGVSTRRVRPGQNLGSGWSPKARSAGCAKHWIQRWNASVLANLRHLPLRLGRRHLSESEAGPPGGEYGGGDRRRSECCHRPARGLRRRH